MVLQCTCLVHEREREREREKCFDGGGGKKEKCESERDPNLSMSDTARAHGHEIVDMHRWRPTRVLLAGPEQILAPSRHRPQSNSWLVEMKNEFNRL